MAEKEALRARKAYAEMENKNRKSKKANKGRELEELKVHKLNDKTDVASVCEEEGYKKSRADVKNTQRQTCKAAERKAAKAKKDREASASLDADEKAMKAARRAARKKISFEKPECEIYHPCGDVDNTPSGPCFADSCFDVNFDTSCFGEEGGCY